MRAEKAAKYKELKQSNNKKELDEWFLNYKPDKKKDDTVKTKPKEKTKTKTKTKTKAKPKDKILDIYGRKTRKNKKRLY
jgi:hypothetical protein